MTNSRNEVLKLSFADKLTILGMFGGAIATSIASTAIILTVFYNTIGALERKNDVQDVRISNNAEEIARLRGK